jgi:murein DD-endopeptidase MepM/ murein hydrolase activator NlpD
LGISQNGTLVRFDEITNPTGGINLQQLVGLAACDPTALYAVEQEGAAFSLWFSNDAGQSWVKESAGMSREIACDHAQLATLDANGNLFVSALYANGAMDPWTNTGASLAVTHIQGGDGTFYGTLKRPAGGYDVYVASNRAISAPPKWGGSPIATIGAWLVTGTGTTMTGTDNLAVGDMPAWPRRAFALEADGTIDTNPTLLAGQNGWGSLDTGVERYTTLTAAAPNLLFGLQNKSGTVHLGRIRIVETACADGVDNDGDGLTDGEDPACVQRVANSFCAKNHDGDYCVARFGPSPYTDQPNQDAALVSCTNHVATVKPGVCEINADLTGGDQLATLDALTPPDPPGIGHYCNVHWPDGSWDFDWNGPTPCDTLLAKKLIVKGQPGPQIVRAGLYSLTGGNSVHVACSNGGLNPARATGVAPLAYAYGAVGHSTNRCIFTVSPDALPIFGDIYDPASYVPGRSTNWYDHCSTVGPVDLAQFGLVASGKGQVDRFGTNKGLAGWESAYDLPLDEGRPVYALSGGIVVANGSRIRNLASQGIGCQGTPNQGELYVQYRVGADPIYRETFVVYYAHVRKRLVVDGQTVKVGQILGYVGATGCTGGFAHLHAGVFRNSNTNAHTDAAPQIGWHVDFTPNLDGSGVNTGGVNSIDPLGWANGHGFDPDAYLSWGTDSKRGFLGEGAWSLDLFLPGHEFKYP